MKFPQGLPVTPENKSPGEQSGIAQGYPVVEEYAVSAVQPSGYVVSAWTIFVENTSKSAITNMQVFFMLLVIFFAFLWPIVRVGIF